MPFEQKYDSATREAAAARVLERRALYPKDRRVLRIVSDEFNVSQQSLRAWVRAAKVARGTPAKPKLRPRFSPVVTTWIEPVITTRIEPEPKLEKPRVAPVNVLRKPASPASVDVLRLEVEAERLRRGNGVLKAAMRVLLDQ